MILARVFSAIKSTASPKVADPSDPEPDENVIFFLIVLTIILVGPPLAKRLKLPGLIGLVAGGVLAKALESDDHAWGLKKESERLDLFATIGKIYLMFIAGLEIDMVQFRSVQKKAMVFGALTFGLPLLGGMAVALAFGIDNGVTAAIFVGSLLASHTLIAYGIISSEGCLVDDSVVIAIGGTIFTDTGSLLVLAICLAEFRNGSFELDTMGFMLLKVVGLIFGCLFVWRWVAQIYYSRIASSPEHSHAQFVFALLSAFVGAEGAELLEIESIVGAFLAGLAINEVLKKHKHVEHTVVFVGQELFFPCFFVKLGVTIDMGAFGGIFADPSKLALALSIVAVLFATKAMAAAITCKIYKFDKIQFLTMWSLSVPQVAATLAACEAGLNAGLVGEDMFANVILLLLVTSLAGPLMTSVFAPIMGAKHAANVKNTQMSTHGGEEGGSGSDFCAVTFMNEFNPGGPQSSFQIAGVNVPINPYDMPTNYTSKQRVQTAMSYAASSMTSVNDTESRIARIKELDRQLAEDELRQSLLAQQHGHLLGQHN